MDNLHEVSIEQEMSASFMDYAMSVIIARALPDVRDGLKPVQAAYPHHTQRSGPLAQQGVSQMREDSRRRERKLSSPR